MTRKSAAQFKPVKKEKEEAVDPKANFEKYKKIELEILGAKKILCNRIDTGNDLREFHRAFFGDTPSFGFLKDMVDKVKYLCDDMIATVEKFEFEDFAKEEIEDPYKDLLVTMDEVKDELDLFDGVIRFNFVRPFAERVLKMHALVLEDCKAAGLVAEDEED